MPAVRRENAGGPWGPNPENILVHLALFPQLCVPFDPHLPHAIYSQIRLDSPSAEINAKLGAPLVSREPSDQGAPSGSAGEEAFGDFVTLEDLNSSFWIPRRKLLEWVTLFFLAGLLLLDSQHRLWLYSGTPIGLTSKRQ